MPFKKVDLRFVVDATVQSGFGHAMRCLQLAQQVTAAVPQVRTLFQGSYSPAAHAHILDVLGVDGIADPDAPIQAAVSVIDRMSDAVDINAWDDGLTRSVAAASGSTIAIFSGDRPPALPPGVIGIGYQPIDADAKIDGWFWGFDYAPVSSNFVELPAGMARRPQRGRLLIALGASPDLDGVRCAVDAALANGMVDGIDVLLSPLHENDAGLRDSFDSSRVVWWSQVADIRPLLLNAEVVMTSYGNLGFEALALGRPVCFLAYKVFQARMAERMAERGVAVNAGIVGQSSVATFSAALSKAFENTADLSRKSRTLFDGKGLDRIRDMIVQELLIE